MLQTNSRTVAGAGYRQVNTGLDTDADMSGWRGLAFLTTVIAWQEITTQVAHGRMTERRWWRSCEEVRQKRSATIAGQQERQV